MNCMALTLLQVLKVDEEGMIVFGHSAQHVHEVEVLVPHSSRHHQLIVRHAHCLAILQGCQDCTYEGRVPAPRHIVSGG
jgi:hypothetical protein